MAVSVDVTLSKIHPPKFPYRCVHCDRHAPDSTVRLHHNGQNPFFLLALPIAWAFGWSHVDAPICTTCKPKFRLQRWTRNIALYAVIFAALVFIGPKLADWSPWGRRLAAIGFILTASIPVGLFEVLRPRRFATTAHGDTIAYEFASPDYAAQFRRLNEPRKLRAEA
jgi:hypothetical protein